MSLVHTDSVALRNAILTDLPIIYEYQRDPDSVQMSGVPSRDEAAFYKHWEKIQADKATMLRTILYDRQVAGYLMSFIMNDRREVGYWLGQEYWGKGIASTALALFIRDHELRRPLYGHVVPHNQASVRVLEKAGFSVVQRAEDGHDWLLRLI